MARKLDIVEDLGNDLIDENSKVLVVGYRRSLNALQDELIEKTAKGNTLTLKGVKTKISTQQVNVTTRSAYVMGQVQLFVMDRSNPNYEAIRKLNQLYSVNNTRLFSVKLVKLARNNVTPIRLTPKERQAARIFNSIVKDNQKTIQGLVNKNTKALRTINKSITTNQVKEIKKQFNQIKMLKKPLSPNEINDRLMKKLNLSEKELKRQLQKVESSNIMKERRKLINARKELQGVKRPLTNKEISTELKKKFGDNNSRLERILDTETHRQNELVKEVVARDQGFKWKIWNTQRDSKVRASHARLDRKRIRIKSMFNVGGHKAPHPGAAVLPPQESIRCRCFLTFE